MKKKEMSQIKAARRFDLKKSRYTYTVYRLEVAKDRAMDLAVPPAGLRPGWTGR